MASLVLGVAGAALLGPAGLAWEGAFGMSGAAIGFSLGSMAGNMLFAPKMPHQYGPRLGDLKVQVSTYGNPLPVVYGAMRVAGNVIWAADIVETAHTSSAGGKGGGGGATQTSYTYSQSFAVALCEGEITGIRKIWANGKLIYNLSDTADIATIIASNKSAAGIRIYTGSESQTADSLIEAYVGAADTPSYRGVAYVVFENLQLADYGNRMPNLEFEVVKSGTNVFTLNSITLPASRPWTVSVHDGVNLIATSLYPEAIATSSDYGATWHVRAHDTSTTGFQNIKGMCIAGNKVVAFGQTGGTLENYLLVSWDHGASWTYVPSFSSSLPGGGNVAVIASNADGSILMAFGQNITYFAVSLDAGETWNSYASGFPSLGTACLLSAGDVFVLVPTSGTTFWRTTSCFDWHAITIPGAGFSGGGGVSSQNTGAYGNGTFVAVSQGSGGKSYVSTDSGLTWTEHSTPYPYTHVAFDGSQFVAMQSNTTYWGTSADGINWTSRETTSANIGGLTCISGTAFAPRYTGGSTTTAYSALPGVSVSAVALSSIVSDICARAGLTAGQIDVTALTDTVDGYVVQRGTARSQIEQLMQAFYFDAVESDGKVKFVKRGGASAVSIPEDDLAAHEYGSTPQDTLLLNRRQEMELPVEYNVQYMDSGAAYAVGTQRSQRLTTDSENKASVNFAIAMSASKARQIVDVLMYDAWTARTSFDFSTGWKYSYLEPTDVVTVTRDGRSYTMRLVDEDFALTSRRSAVLEDATIYSQSAAAAELPAPSEAVGSVPLTKLVLLDVPLLRDVDDGVGFYAAACGYGDGWSGAQLYKSNDGGATWTSFGNAFLNDSAIGAASDALATFTGGNVFDEKNSVTVVLLNGELSSDTFANVLNGANVALLGDEIIQFRTATLVGTNTYTLTGLLRGRQGTEWAMTTHAIGDRFVLLDSSTTYIFSGPSSEYDLARHFRAASFGGFLDDAATHAFTNTAVALIPYAPVLLGGGRNAAGDLTLNWTRRTRIAGGWNNYSDVPLGEASQEYKVRIYSNSGYGAVLRTITGISAATTSYTAAQQTTDFGTPQSTVYWDVLQVSATVGDGYASRGAT